MNIEIQALDTLFFRDARPFTMGDETWANSLFPPSPSVLYGALRSIYFANHPEDVIHADTEQDPTKGLCIQGIAIKRNAELFLPLPHDLVTEKSLSKPQKPENSYKTYPLTFEQDAGYGLIRKGTHQHILTFQPIFALTMEVINILKSAGIPKKTLTDLATLYKPELQEFAISQAFIHTTEEILHRSLTEKEQAMFLKYASHHYAENLSGGMLNFEDFKAYLKGEDRPFYARKTADNLVGEPKIGIARDKNLCSSAQGKLYQINMQRLQRQMNIENNDPHFEYATMRFVLQTTEFPLDQQEQSKMSRNGQLKGFLRLGGEGKGSSYVMTQDAVHVPAPNLSGKYFKLYLATPAIFSQGWKPTSWFDVMKYPNLKITLLTAATGKYQPLGGWDMKKRSPKRLYRAVPAGSVYYFQLEQGGLDDVLDCFHGKSVSDVEGYQQQGFGITYVGACPEPVVQERR